MITASVGPCRNGNPYKVMITIPMHSNGFKSLLLSLNKYLVNVIRYRYAPNKYGDSKSNSSDLIIFIYSTNTLVIVVNLNIL